MPRGSFPKKRGKRATEFSRERTIIIMPSRSGGSFWVRLRCHLGGFETLIKEKMAKEKSMGKKVNMTEPRR